MTESRFPVRSATQVAGEHLYCVGMGDDLAEHVHSDKNGSQLNDKMTNIIMQARTVCHRYSQSQSQVQQPYDAFFGFHDHDQLSFLICSER